MSEEEKKAIEDMDRFANGIDMSSVSASQMQTILNLIGKLQKENKELKNQCQISKIGCDYWCMKYAEFQTENKALKEYIAIAPNLDEMSAVKYREIQRAAYIQGRAEEKQKVEQIIKDLKQETQNLIDNSQGCMLEEDLHEEYGKIKAYDELLN